MRLKSIIEIIKNTIQILSNRAYLFSLLLSILFWCLIKLSKPYSTNLDFSVNFINQPDSFLLQDYAPTTFSVQVQGHGFNLLSHYFSSKELELDLSKIKKTDEEWYEWNANDHYSDIVQQIPYKDQLEKINTERIRINLIRMSQKKIPLVLDQSFMVEAGFVMDTVFFAPDSVLVTAPKSSLAQIDNFKVTYDQESKLGQDIMVDIIIDPAENWHLNVDKVQLNVKLDKLTQGKIKVPIHVLNAPPSSKVKLFPDEVELLFNVPTKYYHGVSQRDFIVKADFNSVDTTNGKVHLQLIQSPDKVEMMALKPNEIDYLFIYQ